MKDNLKFNITMSVVIVFIGICLFSINFINTKRDETFSTINLSLLEEKREEDNINIDTSNNEVIEEEQKEEIKEEDQVYEYYLATLEIPKINFSRGFYDKTSSLNRLSINIKMLNESSYPDEENGNVILAGHSGNYYNSYFADLWQLEIGDEAYIYYNNGTYTYKIVNIYTEPKDGAVAIRRNRNKSTLTLITCTKDDETTQTIYILERI